MEKGSANLNNACRTFQIGDKLKLEITAVRKANGVLGVLSENRIDVITDLKWILVEFSADVSTKY